MARDSRQLKVSEALLAKAVLCIRDSSPFQVPVEQATAGGLLSALRTKMASLSRGR